MKPILPKSEHMIPYLESIDRNRWYSNLGPLVHQLEARFAKMFDLPEGGVVTFNSGTAALTNALRALNLPRGAHCAMPAWTFAATPASAVAAGLSPFFLDVDAKTGQLSPDHVEARLHHTEHSIAAVIVVAPFGASIDTESWDAFYARTQIPVLIDAAAGFDTAHRFLSSRPRHCPMMISLHATKSLGAGEGGILLSTDTEFLHRVRQLSNFGFSADRTISVPGTNGKMSEYAAAVTHAALDQWPHTRKRWEIRTQWYEKSLARMGINRYGETHSVSSTFHIHLPNQTLDFIIESLQKSGIETRRWWGKGCHTQPAYAHFPRDPLPITNRLAATTLAIPFSLDLSRTTIEYITETLRNILTATQSITVRAA